MDFRLVRNNAKIHDVRWVLSSFCANGQCLSSEQMKGERESTFFRSEAKQRVDNTKNGV